MAHLRKAQMRWRLKEPPRGHYVAASIDHRAQRRDGSFAQSANEVAAQRAATRPHSGRFNCAERN